MMPASSTKYRREGEKEEDNQKMNLTRRDD
jgi:hypothetical protein